MQILCLLHPVQWRLCVCVCVRVCVVPCLDGVQAADNSLAHAWDGVAAPHALSEDMLGGVRCESRLPAPQRGRR